MSILSYDIRIKDDAGALVAGAALAIGGTAVTPLALGTGASAGNQTLVTGNLLSGGASASGLPVWAYDLGTGDYLFLYDPQAHGEAYFPLTVSKVSRTITAANALLPLLCRARPSALEQAKILAYASGRCHYDPTTGLVSLYGTDGTTLVTQFNNSYDSSGHLIDRNVVS